MTFSTSGVIVRCNRQRANRPDFKSIQLISCLEYTLLNLTGPLAPPARPLLANVLANDYSGHLWLSVHYSMTSVPAVSVSKFPVAVDAVCNGRRRGGMSSDTGTGVSDVFGILITVARFSFG